MSVRSVTLREWIVVQTSTPAARAVASLTRSGAVVTVTMSAPHGYQTGAYVTIAGATPNAYNGTVKVTSTGDLTFTFAIAGTPDTPATGTITATYVSDAQGGRRETWRTLDTIRAALLEVRGSERLQAQAINAQIDYRFQVRRRVDVTPKMRLLWSPSWPEGAARKTLEIHSINPIDDGRMWMQLETGEVA